MQFGNVVDVAIMRDKNTGKSRGFAFVTFREKTKSQSQMLTQKLLRPVSPHIIHNRVIEIRESDGTKPPDSFLEKQRNEREQQQQNQFNRQDIGQRRSYLQEPPPFRGDYRNQSYESQDHYHNPTDEERRRREQERLRANGVKRDRIFVGGLDYSLRESDLKHHFERYGVVRDVQIVRDPSSGASRGFGFVTMEDDRIAERLITDIQVTMMGNRKVDIRTADPKPVGEKEKSKSSTVAAKSPESGGRERKRDKKKRDRKRKKDRRNKSRNQSKSQHKQVSSPKQLQSQTSSEDSSDDDDPSPIIEAPKVVAQTTPIKMTIVPKFVEQVCIKKVEVETLPGAKGKTALKIKIDKDLLIGESTGKGNSSSLSVSKVGTPDKFNRTQQDSTESREDEGETLTETSVQQTAQASTEDSWRQPL